MTENILVALIAAFPPTLAALIALYQIRKLSRPLDEVNRAVNHRVPGQRRLVELVDDIHEEIHGLADEVREVKRRLDNHQAWHQGVEEEGYSDGETPDI